MAQALDESFFITISELNVSNLDQCIYFTLKGNRCRWSLTSAHQKQAEHLRGQIVADPTQVVSLELLRNYAQANCCGRPGADHRNRIEDKELLDPLATRWQNEIKQRIANEAITPTPTSDEEEESTCSSSTHVPLHCPQTDGNNPILEGQVENPDSLSKVASKSSLTSIELVNLTPTPASVESRYGLRHTTVEKSKSTSTVPKSKFRPRLTEPTKDDTVSFNIRSQLEKRDDETGALYIFKRDSSPGYVKIGWTAKSIQTRLNGWARCGYTPKLIFKVLDVPNAQRAETLTHYELMDEWRAERSCDWCHKTHQEWFEISEERATQVVADWAAFFTLAKPYDDKGSLKSKCQEIVKEMDKNGELITAKELLGHYKATKLTAEQPVVEEPPAKEAASSAQPPKLENFMFGNSSAPAIDTATTYPFSFAYRGPINNEISLPNSPPKIADSTCDYSIKPSHTKQSKPRLPRTPQSNAYTLGADSVFTFQSHSHVTPPRIDAGLLTPASDASLRFKFTSPSSRDMPLTDIALKETTSSKITTPKSMRTFTKKSFAQMTPEPENPVPATMSLKNRLLPEVIPQPPSPPLSPIPSA